MNVLLYRDIMQGQGDCRGSRSATNNNLTIPRIAIAIGDEQFGIWCVICWNDIPDDIEDCNSINSLEQIYIDLILQTDIQPGHDGRSDLDTYV